MNTLASVWNGAEWEKITEGDALFRDPQIDETGAITEPFGIWEMLIG